MQPASPVAETVPSAAAAAAAGGALRGVLPITEWGLLRASGADAQAFLQSQLTQDVTGLSPYEGRLAGYCSAKGRLLASFVVWPDADRDFWLACSADLLEPTLKRLRMFVLRAKCRLDDASPVMRLWGLAGNGIADTAALDPRVVLPAAAGVPRALAPRPVEAPPLAGPPLDPAAWAWLEVASGTPRIVAATSEQFVPQMINFDLVRGVSFSKGCYPGQEVVARSQYRGTVKRRMFLFGADQPLAAGVEVFHEADPTQPAGMVVASAPAPAGGHAALVEIKLAALESGALRAGGAAGAPLHPQPMPYEVQAPA